jgi:uncharacterized protein (DUF885 family)
MQTLPRILLLIAACAPATAWTAAADDLKAVIDQAWEAQLANDPMFASQLGDRRYNDRWADRSLEAIAAAQAQQRDFLRRVYAIDRNALAPAEQLNYELFRRDLQYTVDEYQFNGHLIPFGHRGGVQNLDSNANQLSFESARDFDDWLIRMGKIDVVIEQTISLAEQGRKSGYLPAKILMQRIPNQIAAQLVSDPEASPFYKRFATLPDSLSDAEQQRLRAKARATIKDSVVPAYTKLARYFSDTYLPACRDTIGLSALPNGAAWGSLTPRTYLDGAFGSLPRQVRTLSRVPRGQGLDRL